MSHSPLLTFVLVRYNIYLYLKRGVLAVMGQSFFRVTGRYLFPLLKSIKLLSFFVQTRKQCCRNIRENAAATISVSAQATFVAETKVSKNVQNFVLSAKTLQDNSCLRLLFLYILSRQHGAKFVLQDDFY